MAIPQADDSTLAWCCHRRQDDRMRMPDLMEVTIAVMAVVIVGGAIASILYRLTQGDGDQQRLSKLKHELQQQKTDLGPR
jgi:hypothetical protein